MPVRPDGTPMPVDSNGLLTEHSDSMLLLHTVTRHLAGVLSLPGVIETCFATDPLTAIGLIATLPDIHAACCPHVSTEEAAQAGNIQSLIDNILSGLDKGE